MQDMRDGENVTKKNDVENLKIRCHFKVPNDGFK